jgi:hypothetical protein
MDSITTEGCLEPTLIASVEPNPEATNKKTKQGGKKRSTKKELSGKGIRIEEGNIILTFA